jgi:site-specific DNA-methyltransferase (adenine-specific)
MSKEERVTLLHGDCLEVLKTLESDSVDALVTDPPAGIGFMGKDWDHHKGGRDQWVSWMREVMTEALRVLKPGAHGLVWAIPRTSHWTGTALEDAGFEVRDRIAHVFGSGFPKSMDVSKQLDKAAGAEREVIGTRKGGAGKNAMLSRAGNASQGYRPDGDPYPFEANGPNIPIDVPATDAAKQWQGWGTALKPAMEDWWLVRKPFFGTVAANVLKHGTGGINVDGCRIEGVREKTHSDPRKAGNGWNASPSRELPPGRWPANFTHDGSEEVVGLFPSTGASGQGGGIRKTALGRMNDDAWQPRETIMPGYGDSGSAARFFYCAKTSKADRDEGLEGFALHSASECCEDREPGSAGLDNPRAGAGRTSGARNIHPTVKPTSLMRYLCRLVTPPNGIILDPFMGSGSTGKAAMLEGFRFIGIEREAEYLEIARARINHQLEKVLKEQEKQGPEQLNLID